jgi:hypothetical protein
MRSVRWLAILCLVGGEACSSIDTSGGGAGGGGVTDGGAGSGADGGIPDAGGTGGPADAGNPGGGGAGGGSPDAGGGGTGGGDGSGGSDGGGGSSGGGGSGGGGGGSGGGGAPDAGPSADDCTGLMPGSMPAAISHVETYSSASDPNFCQLPVGDGTGSVALETLNGGHPTWIVFSSSGQRLGSFNEWHGQAWGDPSGFIAYGGSSTNQTVIVASHDSSGPQTGSTEVTGNGTFAPDPSGGLFAAGRFALGSSAPPANSAPVIFMFNADGTRRYGPVPLGSSAAVFGQGVDLSGRAVVILDGSSQFGAGSIAAIWFDAKGVPLTGVFQILSGFQPGVSTWFETSPLLEGNLALRRMDAPSNAFSEERRTSQWLLVLPSGTARADPAPDWLKQRPDTHLELSRSRQAYAFLPWAADAPACSQRVEVVSPTGRSCGNLEFGVDGNACRTRELRLGIDGTVMQMLPADRERNEPSGSPVYTCTLRYWPAALR